MSVKKGDRHDKASGSEGAVMKRHESASELLASLLKQFPDETEEEILDRFKFWVGPQQIHEIFQFWFDDHIADVHDEARVRARARELIHERMAMMPNGRGARR